MSDQTQSNNYVRIFDTSLRDGEQSPGATMTSVEKLEIARSLTRLGVDVIEAGFPAASPDDLLAVQRIASTVGQGRCELLSSDRVPIICGLARSTKSDINRAWEAVSLALKPRIHTFLATSPIHREHKLRMTKEEVLARINEMVRYAKSLCEDIEFSPEDAGRTEPEFLHQAVKTAIDAGATTINIPDTVGYTVPEEFGALIAGIKQNVTGIDDVTISVHCHNDLGLATANTLAGLQNGARQAEVTINGIGERAGNTALEEVVMVLRTRKPVFGLDTGIDSPHIARVSQMISHITGMRVQPNKAIVGANAFAHEAGIHQDGMLKNQDTYEIMRPESVGVTESQLVLGKHSGRHAFSVRLIDLGYHLQETELTKAFQEFKRLADTKKYVTDSDLAALASSGLQNSVEYYALEDLQVACGTRGMATATVRLRVPDGTSRTLAIMGSGPVHACFKAIDMIVSDQSDSRSRLLEYSVHSCTQGIDALGEVSIRLGSNESEAGMATEHYVQRPQTMFHGQGADTDIILASAKAYLSAINRRLASSLSSHAQVDRPKTGRAWQTSQAN